MEVAWTFVWALRFILHSAKPSGNEGSRQQQSLQFSSFEREITLFLAPLEFSTKKSTHILKTCTNLKFKYIRIHTEVQCLQCENLHTVILYIVNNDVTLDYTINSDIYFHCWSFSPLTFTRAKFIKTNFKFMWIYRPWQIPVAFPQTSPGFPFY